MTLDLASNTKNFSKPKFSKLYGILWATTFSIVAACSSSSSQHDTSIDGAQPDGTVPDARRILPPQGSRESQKQEQKYEVDKLLEIVPPEAKGSDSEISIPLSDIPSGSFGRSEDEFTKRRRESRNRRTDNEIVGSARSMDERHAEQLGSIDKDLNLEPAEKSGESPSFIIKIQTIKDLYKNREFEEALVETNEALRYFPKSAHLLTMKGTLHQKLGNIELALASYERANAIEATNKLEAQIEYLRSILLERANLARKRDASPLPGFEATPKSTLSSEEGGSPK